MHRLASNISISALAKAIGSDRHNLEAMERELYYPKRETSMKLAQYFKLDTKYFYDSFLEEADNLPDKLIAYRKKNNLNKAQAARLNKVCPSSWKGWEDGSILISREKYMYLKELGLF